MFDRVIGLIIREQEHKTSKEYQNLLLCHIVTELTERVSGIKYFIY